MAERKFDLRTYVPVHERLAKFRVDHPLWGLITQVISDDGKRIVMRAVVTDEEGRHLASGHAEEIRGEGQVNKTNPVENCETSAWGRALANLGYSIDRGIASREEMARANGEDGYEPDAWFIQNGWESQAQHDEWRKSALAHLKYDADLRRSFNEFREGGTLLVSSFADGPHPVDEAEAIQAWLCERDRHHFVSQSEGLDACADCGERAPF